MGLAREFLERLERNGVKRFGIGYGKIYLIFRREFPCALSYCCGGERGISISIHRVAVKNDEWKPRVSIDIDFYNGEVWIGGESSSFKSVDEVINALINVGIPIDDMIREAMDIARIGLGSLAGVARVVNRYGSGFERLAELSVYASRYLESAGLIKVEVGRESATCFLATEKIGIGMVIDLPSGIDLEVIHVVGAEFVEMNREIVAVVFRVTPFEVEEGRERHVVNIEVSRVVPEKIGSLMEHLSMDLVNSSGSFVARYAPEEIDFAARTILGWGSIDVLTDRNVLDLLETIGRNANKIDRETREFLSKLTRILVLYRYLP